MECTPRSGFRVRVDPLRQGQPLSTHRLIDQVLRGRFSLLACSLRRTLVLTLKPVLSWLQSWVRVLPNPVFPTFGEQVGVRRSIVRIDGVDVELQDKPSSGVQER